jgi:L-lactate dehydrogenase
VLHNEQCLAGTFEGQKEMTINEPLAAAMGMLSTGPAAGTAKIAIAGPGHVGVTLAYACLIRGTGKTIALYGRNAQKVRAEVADLQDGLQFVPMATVVGSDDVEVCRDADVLVLTAGVPPRPGQRRLDLAADGVAICRDLLPRLLEVAPGAVLVIVTNPVDVVTYAALKIGGLPHHRVLGSGTVLDSSRLRSLIARRCDVAVQNVHAYIAGEHGDSEIPLWTSATVGGFRSCTGRTPSDRRSPPPRGKASAARWCRSVMRCCAARDTPTTPSRWPRPGSSRPCCTTSIRCCRSARC